MRISTKLTLSLTSIGLLIFICYGLYHLAVEQRDLTQVIKLQTKLLGKGLQIAIENAMRDKQPTDITELLKGLEQIEPALKIRVYDQQGNAFPDAMNSAYEGDFQDELHIALKKHEEVLFFYPKKEPEYVTLLLPLTDVHGEKQGILVFVRDLHEMRRDLYVTRRNLVISIIVFILIATPICTIICMSYIGWPLARLADGMRRIQEGNFSPLPLKNHQDEISALLEAFNTMAAELKNARQKLKEEAQLRRHVQAGLQEADKLITIGQLSAGLAHEIGSPLQVLKGRAEHLQLCANQPDEVIRHARILASQTERITGIVQQLLEFTRRRPSHFAEIDLRAPVQAVLNLLEYEALRQQVELSFTSEEGLPLIFADSGGIQQIVLNLITNALAATAAGGHIDVVLASYQQPPGAAGKAVPAIQLTVRDDGRGISAEVVEHLFEPFFTTRDKQGGVGLGLAVARSIVTAHNGVIKAESAPGQGSLFTIILPVEEGRHAID